MQESPALFCTSFLTYFIQKAVIKGVQVLYQNEVFGIVWDADISLLLEVYRKDGSKREHNLNIRGHFKRDHSGKIIDWGSCFKIKKLFQALGINGTVGSDGTISQDSLDTLKGREIYCLSFISGIKEDGSKKYDMYDILSDSKETLEQDFHNSVDRGFVRSYHPEILFEDSTIQESSLGSNNLTDDILDDSDEFGLLG